MESFRLKGTSEGWMRSIVKAAWSAEQCEVQRRKICHKKVIRKKKGDSGRHPKVTGVKTHHVQKVLWQQDATRCVIQAMGHDAKAM